MTSQGAVSVGACGGLVCPFLPLVFYTPLLLLFMLWSCAGSCSGSCRGRSWACEDSWRGWVFEVAENTGAEDTLMLSGVTLQIEVAEAVQVLQPSIEGQTTAAARNRIPRRHPPPGSL